MISSHDYHRLLTAKDITEGGGPSERTLERMRAEGGGPAYVRIGAKLVRYRMGDYEAWLASRTFPHLAAEHAA